MQPVPIHWRVVLVRPRNPLNIGAAARAMANFGLQQLIAVRPYAAAWQETRSAVGAEEIVLNARAVTEITAALEGVSLVVGTTAGTRRQMTRPLLPLPELGAWLAEQHGHRQAALLFGSEKTGLGNDEMSFCHALVRIPTLEQTPSMNLGQAVAVCCYELSRQGLILQRAGGQAMPLPRPAHTSAPAPTPSLEHLFERAAHVLDHVGYLQPKSRAATLRKLRRMMLDHRLTQHDAKILGGMLAQIEWKLKTT